MKKTKNLSVMTIDELIQLILELQEENRLLKEELARAKKCRPNRK